MSGEVRKTLVWATAVAAVGSAALLASSGGGPRIAGLVAEPARAGPAAGMAKTARQTSRLDQATATSGAGGTH